MPSSLPLLPFFLFLALTPPTLSSSTPATTYATGTSISQPANLSLTSWTGPNCTGTPISNTDIEYDSNTEAETRSYKLSRALEEGEQLDWSGVADGFVARRKGRRDDAGLDPYCGLFDHSVVGTGKGQGTVCVELEKVLTCFRLWHY